MTGDEMEPDQPKFAIGIVTYRPGSSLLQRLSLSLEEGHAIYIFDNSPEESMVREFCSGKKGCNYTTTGKNVGLGFGISSVCAQAYYDSYSKLLFFDQDTVFDGSTLQFVAEFSSRHPGLSASHSAVWFNAKNYVSGAVTDDIFAFRDVLMAINSGSLFFLENVKKLNWMNEKLFVDCVDYDFCLRSSNQNYRIAECTTTPGFDHQSEQAEVQRQVFGNVRQLRKYSLRRIVDTTLASLQLLATSIMAMNSAFAIAITRSLAGYLFWQVAARVLNIKPINGK